MLEFFGVRIYLGTPAWGWTLYGIGYESKWFLGLSIRRENNVANRERS